MARAKTAAEIVEKQIRKAAGAVQDYKDGVRSVEESPTAAAARKVDKYKAGILEAIDDGSYVDGLNSVSREEWIEKTVDKGGSNYAKGVERSRNKLMEFQEQIMPVRARVREQVRAMPNDTFDERMARMEANARGLHEFKFKKRSRKR